jgi:hypothetical protein
MALNIHVHCTDNTMCRTLNKVFNPLKTEGVLRKFQKVIELTQKWKDLKNNGTT